MNYKCVVKDSMDTWLTEGKLYNGEPVIPPLTPDENWVRIKEADDGYPAFVRAKQLQRVFDKPEEMNV